MSSPQVVPQVVPEKISSLIIPLTGVAAFIEKVTTQLEDLSDLEIFYNQVLVAKYIRTTVGTSGRILSAHQTQKEDQWQGKIGYVLKLGPTAFINEPGFDFHGLTVSVGDWILLRNTDGWDFDYTPQGGDKFHLRLLEDTQVKGRTTRPDAIW